MLQIIKNDAQCLKKGLDLVASKLPLPNPNPNPNLLNHVEDAIWLRNFEDPSLKAPLPPLLWPQPWYSGLTGLELLLADLKALGEYADYLRHASRIWHIPLPETYDPELVADYFSCRLHVLIFRVIEVFFSFASAAIKMRTSAIFKSRGSRMEPNDGRNQSQYYMGTLLKEAMLNLGPTFVKVGQSLSTRPDIIGSEICKVLSELHEQIPPFSRIMAMKIIEEELGSPVDSVFNFISEEAVAAASFGQVYRACTLDGSTVAVKVQRPRLNHVVLRDVYLLRLGLGLLRKVAKRKSDLCLYADEIGKGLLGELDYTLEAANATEFREVHARFPFMAVPKVFTNLSGKRVITMEWLAGEKPNELLLLSQGLNYQSVGNLEQQQLEARKCLFDLVNKGVEASLVQLLETGLLHADPHPGNLRYTRAGQIGFLDFGLLCQMEKRHQLAMLASIVHIVNGDWSEFVRDLFQMDIIRPGTNVQVVTMELEDSLGEVVWKDGLPDIKFSRVLGTILSIAFEYQFRMPPYYTLVLRSIASLEGLAVAVDPTFKTFQAAYPYVVQKLLTDNSVSMRRILHSVVFNARKELQWKKLALFVKIGATKYRKSNGLITTTDGDTSINLAVIGQSNIFQVANLILKLLPSKDGMVLRRLLMTADTGSLVRALVSKEAAPFRHQFGMVLADVIYEWAFAACQPHMVSQNLQMDESLRVQLPIYQACLRDRRLKLIFKKGLNNLRRDPFLMIRFGWVASMVVCSAFAQACHRLLVSWSMRYAAPVTFAQRQFAVGT
ncbi:uncharacterized protein LOC18444254 [Amborella trichopoda]|uniref:Protein kinase domain-containing protein n=1 Tax=Amborella trichopoda TaxID=13333 RepID=U5CRV2_AMBTC|nr:uncharacterized protein LOC18444254 [Amborella trichopoda]ERN15956.1 hypothetical protein AMTR_s00175p00037000 [Amborella trichopoda]|eukprot:XP_006854489.1 uncharacterized protein LOC18444254 [Amborella trichopoda]